MPKNSIVKYQNKLFAINLSWHELDSSKDVKQITKLFRKSNGVSFNFTAVNNQGVKEKKILIGLTQKKQSNCYSLSALVANKLKSGIFITDKLNLLNDKDISNKLYWVCIFQNNQVIANINIADDIVINGDELFDQEQLEFLIKEYSKNFKVSIFTDLIDSTSLNFVNSKIKPLDNIITPKISNKYLIKKINSNSHKTILTATVILLIFGCGLGFYFYLSNLQVQKVALVESKEFVPKNVPEKQILQDIQANSSWLVLSSLDELLKKLPVVLAGWSLQSMAYVSSTDNIQILYQKHDGMDIVHAQIDAQALIVKHNFENASVSFSNNDTIMQSNFKLPKIHSSHISNLSINDVVSISYNDATATIASIQQQYFNYQLGNTNPFHGSYSKQDISITNIDPLIFKALTSLAHKHINLVTIAMLGKFDNNFNVIWEFQGEIYA